MDKIEELLTRGVANIIPNKDELKKALSGKKKLNVYLGIDPTATRIHLGHTIALRKLQAFAELGHNVTFLIGDFTALIGDTSDKDKERPVLSSEEIRRNFATYKEQAQKILDFSKVKIKYNSEWLKKLDFTEIVKLCQTFSVNDFISRELIRKRLDQEKRVGLHEELYPVMQGYDSYFMDTDIQLGGADQTFNMQAGRTLQKLLRKKESFIITNVYLEGTDGRKMSKSWGNAIWLDDNPNNMYAKVMSIKDDLIINYFKLATNLSINAVGQMANDLQKGQHPMYIKHLLATHIVLELHSPEAATKAKEYFEKTIQKQELPEDIPVYLQSRIGKQNIIDLLVDTKLAESRGEAKRLIEQGGVAVDDKVIINSNEQFIPKDNSIIRVGKRRFIKIKTS